MLLRHRRRARGGGADALELTDEAPAALLHGFQTFPTPVEEIRFRELAGWKDRYRLPVGFLDHTDGGGALALAAAALAVAWGDNLVEKHSDARPRREGLRLPVLAEPGGLLRMVELLRQAEAGRRRRARRPEQSGASLPPAHGPPGGGGDR